MPIYLIIRVCVRLYSFTVKASSDCKMSETYLRGTDQRTCVVNISRVLLSSSSSRYLKMSYFTSKDENSSQHKLERKRHDILTPSEKIIYIDIGYKSAPN